MTRAVVDANVAVKWFVADQEFQAQAFAVRGEYDCWAPALIVSEVANTLWRYVRIGKLRLDVAQESVETVAEAFTVVEDRRLARDAQRLSAEVDHPIYDCLYASLAMRMAVPLITADRKLIRKLSGVAGLALFDLSTVPLTKAFQ